MSGQDKVEALLDQLNTHGYARDAIVALGQIGTPAVGPLIQALDEASGREHFDNLVSALIAIGPPALDALIASLSNPAHRGSTAWILGHIGDPRAVDALIPLLKDRSADTRYLVVHALGLLAGPEAIPHLEGRLKDRAEIVRLTAQDAILKLQAKVDG